MSYTLQQSINFAQAYTQYPPFSAGTGDEPAISIANEIQNTVRNPPFTWASSRAENNATSTVVGISDYTFSLANFSFLEGITLTDPNGINWDVQNIYNNKYVGVPTSVKPQRPNGASVLLATYGMNLKLRFIGSPDQIYQITLTYQKLPVAFTTLSNTWDLPDAYIDIYNNLFVGECMAIVDDARANQYRQRGIAALLGKAEGLTEMQKNQFLEQYWIRDYQQQSGNLRTQQGNQARGI